MTTTVILDASALLRFLDNESGADQMERLLLRCATGEATLLMTAISWGECVYAIVRRKGMEAGQDLIDRLSSLRIAVVPSDAITAQDAAFLKARYKIPNADAISASLAIKEGGTLVTADFDFKKLPTEILEIQFLPGKT